ncbi:ligase-associated DNA damage response endonuclease PdeM [Paracoccus suum]|uniref:Ligase-associated DNA damage response endonuclease PdeM n=1 Tax=Paracoccus suum TaxID=2259340 RepID=A0A344PIJ0_9RHOB|nr:ligase-associated DNA damage response endonuclease PdeM [Paracoccus suum]AXC49195.1 ligase-associated DNA damage response endonuclease PdeM [Paracoccus suum]
MTAQSFRWHGLALQARCAGSLWWPEGRWLIVADLHLGKSERMARRGGALLPPYEGLATLERLRAEIEATDPAVVISPGDGFDDDAAAGDLDVTHCAILHDLARGREWIWLAGNHDPGAAPCDHLPGRMAVQARLGPAVLRHEAVLGDGPDISGHYHPAVRIAGRRARAFLIGADHLILPAFGAYTGGLDAQQPRLAALTAGGIAIACLHRAIALPLQTRAAG